MHRRLATLSASQLLPQLSRGVSAAASLCGARRCTGEFSILGTSTLTPEFIAQFREETLDNHMIAEEDKQAGGIFAACVKRGEAGGLDHIDSPEADTRHLTKLERQMEKLFAAIPEPKSPEDALRMARRPTRGELEENEKLEVLKEAMREKYQRQLSRRKQEDQRISAAMQAVEDGTYEAKFQRERPPALFETEEEMKANRRLAEPENMEKLQLLQQLEQAKAELRKMKEELAKAQANGGNNNSSSNNNSHGSSKAHH